MSGSVDDDKRALRRRVRAARGALGHDDRRRADAAIAERGSALFSGARTIACYVSAPFEPPTRALIAAAREAGIRVLLPISGPGGILDWSDDASGERITSFGVPETTGRPLGPEAIAQADLVFAPAAAVDERGSRLGWGAGYYDRALTRLDSRRPVYAVLYDADVVGHVPREAHDVPVTGIVTPTRTLTFDR